MNEIDRRIWAADCWLRCTALLMKAYKQNSPDDLICRLKSLIIEIDKFSDDQPRDEHGRWTSGGGSSGGSKNPKRTKSPKMSSTERKRVSSGIATDFPKLEADGTKRKYDYGNYSYDFYVRGFGSYQFVGKYKIK